VCKFS
jgi:dehydrogenase/reductase SDR family protein 7B